MLNLTVENGTFVVCLTELLEIERFWHLTECKQKSILILNWIVWIRTVGLNWIAWNRN